MIVSPSEMKIIEERAFASGIRAESLMEEAGAQVAVAVRQFFPGAGRCVAFFGKGHNGGDALVAARHLVTEGWRVDLRPAFAKEDWSELTRRQHDEYSAARAREERRLREPAVPPLVVLDGLIGTGAGGQLRGPVRDGARAINRLRVEENGFVFAIDLPTGVDGETGEAAVDAVQGGFHAGNRFREDRAPDRHGHALRWAARDLATTCPAGASDASEPRRRLRERGGARMVVDASKI